MAGFTRVNGDFKPVAVFDAQEYSNTGVNVGTSAATVQPQGPKLNFFTFTAAGALTASDLASLFQTVQQLATVHIFEYTDAANDTVAMAVYPVDGWSAASMQSALQALGGNFAAGTVAATATFTN